MRYRVGQVVRAPSGGTYVPKPLPRQCRRCGADPWVDVEALFEKWLPATQHASDSRTRAVVEVTYPFEFRGYETWNIALYIRFLMPPAPDGLETETDRLSGKRFGPFSCLCEADKAIETWFEAATGRKYQIGDNCYDAMRNFIQGGPGA